MAATMPPDLPAILPAASLDALNTLAVPAIADFLAQVDSVAQLQAVLLWWRQQQSRGVQPRPITPLGGGSNVVLAGDLKGLVLRLNILGREVIQEDDKHVWLRVGAGENWHTFVTFCMNFHYWGLENLALIPGSVGAAPIQNIGAYGRFGYRDSVFKQHLKDRYIITSVTFRLNKQPQTLCTYPALQQYFNDQQLDPSSVSPQQVFDAVCTIRNQKLPDPALIPNVGSFFKNPVVSEAQFAELSQQHPGLVGYSHGEGQVKLAAGWLIDRAGWRGYQQGAVGVHKEQALVLVNPGRGQGKEIISLAAEIQTDIQTKYGVSLEIEPRVYGVAGPH
jgi:UDP-N-acetylmuramate dehydrogenase